MFKEVDLVSRILNIMLGNYLMWSTIMPDSFVSPQSIIVFLHVSFFVECSSFELNIINHCKTLHDS